MTTMTVDEVVEGTTNDGAVTCTSLDDGIIVTLTGELTTQPVIQDLRDALLRPLPAECRDVLVNVGAVSAVDEAAIAVLLAAKDWVRGSKRRFAITGRSTAIDLALREARLSRALPRLGPPRRKASVPGQRGQ